MKTIGRRKVSPVGVVASGALLADGALFNDEIHRLPTGNTAFIPKGVYRFTAHADANQHQMDCLAKGMASVAQGRTIGKLEELCRPASLDNLKSLMQSLNQQGVEYLLIGGFASLAHGHYRTTNGIDVLVPATLQSGIKVKEALMVLPDQVAKDLEPVWFTEGECIRVADAFLLDIVLNACGETYDTLKQFAVTVDLDGIPVRILKLEGLLLTKSKQGATRMSLTGTCSNGRWTQSGDTSTNRKPFL